MPRKRPAAPAPLAARSKPNLTQQLTALETAHQDLARSYTDLQGRCKQVEMENEKLRGQLQEQGPRLTRHFEGKLRLSFLAGYDQGFMAAHCLALDEDAPAASPRQRAWTPVPEPLF